MLQEIVDWVFFGLLGLDSASKAVQIINFFVYDTIKIFLLLFVMISAIGFLRTYLPKERIKKLLAGKKEGVGNIMAALFGAVTPFCSCSSIPIFIGFLRAGVPLGVTFSFLITSPLINEYVVVLMWGFFGWKVTLLYVLFGLLIGTFAGLILGRMKLEKYLVKDITGADMKDIIYKKFVQRIKYGVNEAMSIIKSLWLWVIGAVGLAAAIHNYIPDSAIQSLISRGGIFTVPIAVIIGVPMYASCAAIVPIAVVLFQKGVPLGTALAFMMAVAALSLPEAIILRRAMKLKLILIFFGIVALSIVAIGYLFNFVAPLL
jgi:uncharacterized membrane protein YraQ (UPF0718 family)